MTTTDSDTLRLPFLRANRSLLAKAQKQRLENRDEEKLAPKRFEPRGFKSGNMETWSSAGNPVS